MSLCLKVSILSAALLLAVQPTVSHSADKAAAARNIVNKGIEFFGGEKNLKKYKGANISEKGTYYGMGDGLPYTAEYAVEYPDKFHMNIVGVFKQIVNGDKGWVVSGGNVTEMTKAQLKALQGQHYVGLVTQLYPLVDKKYTLEHTGNGKVGDQNVALIKVTSKGHRDVTLAINPKTGALLKVEYKAAMEDMPDKIVTYIAYNDEFKTAGNIKYASKTRVIRDGKKFIESEITDYKPAEKLDPNLFAKPE